MKKIKTIEPTEEELEQEAMAQAEYEAMIAGLEAEQMAREQDEAEYQEQQEAEAEAEYYSQQGPDY